MPSFDFLPEQQSPAKAEAEMNATQPKKRKSFLIRAQHSHFLDKVKISPGRQWEDKRPIGLLSLDPFLLPWSHLFYSSGRRPVIFAVGFSRHLISRLALFAEGAAAVVERWLHGVLRAGHCPALDACSALLGDAAAHFQEVFLGLRLAFAAP